MFDALEQEFKNTTHVDLINQLYQGKCQYILCLYNDYTVYKSKHICAKNIHGTYPRKNIAYRK